MNIRERLSHHSPQNHTAEAVHHPNKRLIVLADWLGAHPTLHPVPLSTSDLFEQLRRMFIYGKNGFPFQNPAALGSWLGRSQGLIDACLHVSVTVIPIRMHSRIECLS